MTAIALWPVNCFARRLSPLRLQPSLSAAVGKRFVNPSYISFFILNFRSLDIQVHRYGSFITQLVPYIGQQLQLPIKPVLIGYAVSFNLFYLINVTFPV